MHLTVLIIHSNAVLKALGNGLIVYYSRRAVSLGVYYYLKDIQQLAPVATTLAEKSFSLTNIYFSMLEYDILLKSPAKKRIQILYIKAFEHKNLTSREKGSDNLK